MYPITTRLLSATRIFPTRLLPVAATAALICVGAIARDAPSHVLDWPEQKVIASDGIAHDAFGQAIAIRGTTALIGAVDANDWEGAIYVFSQSDGVWTQGQKFMASDGAPGDQATFGTAIAIDGDTAVIGALGATIDGHANQGAAYVFTETDGVWSEIAKLVAEDGDTNNYFGQTVAISGANIVVGAYGANVDGNDLQGTAYVFNNSSGSWKLAQKLAADDAAGGAFFGRAVAMSGSQAFVAAPYTAANDVPAAGAVYVFDGSDGTWTQTQKLFTDDGNPGDGFGFSLAAAGSTLVAGANGSGGGQGAAYVFAAKGTQWTQAAKLTADDGAMGDDLGYAVAVFGDSAIVGADRATVGSNTQQGAAYVFSNTADSWIQTQKVIASDGNANEFYGAFVALTDATALVGVPYATVDNAAVRGAAYFYARDDATSDTVFKDGFDDAP